MSPTTARASDGAPTPIPTPVEVKVAVVQPPEIANEAAVGALMY